MIVVVVAALVVLVLAYPARILTRYALVFRSPARAHYWPMIWAAVRWRWLARNAGLAYLDHYRRATRPRLPFTTAVRVHPEAKHLMRYPRAHFRVDAHGWTATVRTIPKVGHTELAKAAPWLADAWACHRVGVTRPKPGRVVIRAMRSDPLAEPFSFDSCPPGLWTADTPARLYLGRDEWANHRWLPLGGVTGVTVAGLPGFGKSTLLASWLGQLAGSPAVQFVLLDGKDAGDQEDWRPRAWLSAGDGLAEAEAVLTEAYNEMLARRGRVVEATGHRNAWRAGPSDRFPLLVVVLDECQQFLDVAQYKGDAKAEALARRCVSLTAQLVRKGRSVMVLTILATQKPTGDSLPTAIRDNCALSVAFALKTRDAAVAALGDGIRDWPTVCPTVHQSIPEGVGVATAMLRTGLDPFTRLRVPEITEEAAAGRAAATAHQRRVPAALALPAAAEAPSTPAVLDPAA